MLYNIPPCLTWSKYPVSYQTNDLILPWKSLVRVSVKWDSSKKDKAIITFCDPSFILKEHDTHAWVSCPICISTSLTLKSKLTVSIHKITPAISTPLHITVINTKFIWKIHSVTQISMSPPTPHRGEWRQGVKWGMNLSARDSSRPTRQCITREVNRYEKRGIYKLMLVFFENVCFEFHH